MSAPQPLPQPGATPILPTSPAPVLAAVPPPRPVPVWEDVRPQPDAAAHDRPALQSPAPMPAHRPPSKQNQPSPTPPLDYFAKLSGYGLRNLDALGAVAGLPVVTSQDVRQAFAEVDRRYRANAHLSRRFPVPATASKAIVALLGNLDRDLLALALFERFARERDVDFTETLHTPGLRVAGRVTRIPGPFDHCFTYRLTLTRDAFTGSLQASTCYDTEARAWVFFITNP